MAYFQRGFSLRPTKHVELQKYKFQPCLKLIICSPVIAKRHNDQGMTTMFPSNTSYTGKIFSQKS